MVLGVRLLCIMRLSGVWLCDDVEFVFYSRRYIEVAFLNLVQFSKRLKWYRH